LSDTAKAMVVEAYSQPMQMREFELPDPQPGALLVDITAAGVCGSDVHIWAGKDPRTRLPMILGHEGVGRIRMLNGPKRDLFGEELKVGDKIVWHRGVTCGRCVYCAKRREPSLCLYRKVYGTMYSCDQWPYLTGNYAEVLYVHPQSEIMKLPEDCDDGLIAAATCSGATAAHTIELLDITMGSTVVIIGPGPLGLYTAAYCFERGADQVFIFGTAADIPRLQLAESFGCIPVNVDEVGPDERRQAVLDATHGLGADYVIECTGVKACAQEAVDLACRGGSVAIPGIAVPVGEMSILPFEQIAVRNLRLQGVWVSDARHMYEAVTLTLSGKYPLQEMITHRFPLSQANEALQAIATRQAIKAIIEPQAK